MVVAAEPPEQGLSLVHNTVVLGTGQGEEHILELGHTQQVGVHIVVVAVVAGGMVVADMPQAAEGTAWAAVVGKVRVVAVVDMAWVVVVDTVKGTPVVATVLDKVPGHRVGLLLLQTEGDLGKGVGHHMAGVLLVQTAGTVVGTVTLVDQLQHYPGMPMVFFLPLELSSTHRIQLPFLHTETMSAREKKRRTKH